MLFKSAIFVVPPSIGSQLRSTHVAQVSENSLYLSGAFMSPEETAVSDITNKNAIPKILFLTLIFLVDFILSPSAFYG